MGGKKGIRDPRFVIEHEGDAEYSLVTRVSDGQMLFLANKLAKMRQDTRLGSRIAEVHNGSALFTGAAGSGESNIPALDHRERLLEAIVALPLNLFYNTGIATYVWVLTNRKPDHRRARPVDRRDPVVPTATEEPRPEDSRAGRSPTSRASAIRSSSVRETEQSRIFDIDTFGYWKVPVERPLRIKGADSDRVYKPAEIRR